jgi:hypothetical protein
MRCLSGRSCLHKMKTKAYDHYNGVGDADEGRASQVGFESGVKAAHTPTRLEHAIKRQRNEGVECAGSRNRR